MKLFALSKLKLFPRFVAVVIANIFAFFSLQTAAAQDKLFQPVETSSSGLSFQNELVETEALNVLSYEYFFNGGAVAAGDINNDGLIDLFFTANMKPNKLYLNQGGLKFKDITKQASPLLEGKPGGWKTGATMADVNGDGYLDIYVCYSGKVTDELRRNQLFINDGKGKFNEQAAQYGLDDKSFSTQAAFFDFDNDGDLDMFLLNHSNKKIDNMELARYRKDVDELAGNKLYQNVNGKFVDVSYKAGIRQNPLTFGLGIAIADVNLDGWQDVYVTNDYNEPDYLYINNHDGSFKDVTKESLKYLSQFSMGVEIADYNNDALPDIITLDMLPPDNRRQKLLQLQENYESFELMVSQGLQQQYMRNMLQLNNGNGTFSEIGRMAGISATDWSWCPLLADFDNDGFKDLFVTNGYLRDYTNKDFLRYWGDYKVRKAVEREPTKLMDLVTAMPSTTLYNNIFSNDKGFGFQLKNEEWGFKELGISSAAIYADLDNDGDLELVINRINQPVGLYRNFSREKNTGNFISIQLQYKPGNINAYGTKLYMYSNKNVQYQEVNPARGYLSAVSTVAHFGTGNLSKIDSIKIIWPDGQKQVINDVKTNQRINITYTAGTNTKNEIAVNTDRSIFKQAAPVITYTSSPVIYNDFKRQLLMTFMYSAVSPVIAKGDINNDGLEDLFIGEDATKPGRIYLQEKNGTFAPGKDTLSADEQIQAGAVAIADFNKDGRKDVYVAAGGYGLKEQGSTALQDRIYFNNGTGGLVASSQLLPDLSSSSKSCVRPADFDNDGDIDLFVGGRVIPGKFPLAPQSYLLQNDGKGMFTRVNTLFDSVGMVTDAGWIDLNKDGRRDLVICGEFMPIKAFINTKDGWKDQSAEYFDGLLNGFWFSLHFEDVNGDGSTDIIAGNLGLNSPLQISKSQPAQMYFADFDQNGSIDPFLNFYVGGKSFPFVSRDELNEQMYVMRRKFSSYKDYSTAGMKEIVDETAMKNAGKLEAYETRSVVFLNKGGKFVLQPLPIQAQFTANTVILCDDYNKDGKKDLLLFGNKSDNRLKFGSVASGYGCLLAGDDSGGFTYIDQSTSGLTVQGDVKSAVTITVNQKKYIVIGIHGEQIRFYEY
jgi:hypothetical protein